jgi:H+/Cl- antiporter ClcA
MFASVALGLAVNLVFPGIPVAVTVAATMAGELVAAMRAPLFAALFTLALVQIETSPAGAVTVVASALLTALLALRAARRAADQAQPLPEVWPRQRYCEGGVLCSRHNRHPQALRDSFPVSPSLA